MPDDLNPEPPVIGGRGHKPTCECRTCKRIRHMHSLGQAKAPNKRRLGPRQVRKRAFVKAYTDPLSPTFGNQSKSAQSAGFAASSGTALLKDRQVSMLRAALERHGIDDDYLAAGLKEGLRAEEVKLSTFEGKFTDERRIPDFHARVKFQEMAHRLRGDLQKDELPQQVVLVINVPEVVSTPGHDYDCACRSSDLTEDISQVHEVGRHARSLILEASLPDDLEKAIRDAYQRLCDQYGPNTDVAIRSSATAEDLPDPSFAGQHETCGHGDPSLTPEGGCHMVLRKDKVEIGNSGLCALHRFVT